jgi:regulator of nucleoside diphosphate kinase
MNTIYITKNDHSKLVDLISGKWPNDDYDQALLAELNRAEIVEPTLIPSDVITMNSHLVLVDGGTGESAEYAVVFPEHADASNNKISVLSPLGCALLGCRVGDTVDFRTPSGQKSFKVEKILHQPEAAGNFD